MTEPLSRHLALRVGLAARALEDTDPARLLDVLAECVSLPLTESALERLSVVRLRQARGGEFAGTPVAQLRDALRVLRGEFDEVTEEDLPSPDPQAVVGMGHSLRVACASNGGERVDGHFGSCKRFLIYQVSAQASALVELRDVSPPRAGEDKTAHRVALIADCDLLYLASIGGPAAAAVVRAGVHPIKCSDGGEAPQLLGRLSQVLDAAPPPWLAKAMGLRGVAGQPEKLIPRAR
jgi:nitrogen fixation protein NifX